MRERRRRDLGKKTNHFKKKNSNKQKQTLINTFKLKKKQTNKERHSTERPES